MRKFMVALALLVGCAAPGQVAEVPAELEEFFDEPVVTAQNSPADAAGEAPADAVAEGVLSVSIVRADDGDNNYKTFALDIVVQGLEGFPGGFSSFQIADVSVPACTRLVRFLDGTMLGPKVYPFQSHGVISDGSKPYTARFGGFGASTYPVTESGSLFRFFFEGNCNPGEASIVLHDFFFQLGFERLAQEPSDVRFDF